MHSLVEMLRYMRPEGTLTQREFCKRFLEPVFGRPDEHGNYVTQVGYEPHLCFTAHHDTVHKQEGMQQVVVTNDVVSVADSKVSSCLGADCTTGIYIILCMIEAGIEGTYVIHAAEEVGCKGSAALVDDMPDWLMYTKAVISFDRYGDKSVITHQMGMRTASDDFAKSFAEALNMPQLKSDDGGSYTDSNEYSLLIPECTNISVGYYGQHGVNETQDLQYLDQLIYALETADWSKLVFKRDPSVIESLYYNKGSYPIDNTRDKADVDGLMDIVIEYPQAVAEMLREYGWTPMSLMEECQIDDMSHYYNYLDSYATRRYS
jgi:hypothetical protein